DHRACRTLLETSAEPIIVPDPVVGETGFMIGQILGPTAEAAFLRSLAGGELRVEGLTPADLGRMAELVETYADLPLGTADASVVAVAERLNIGDVATLDHRHFTVVRPRHVAALRLVP
ncbi:MAG TPA: PIN domain-containing protein, partial [Acidimicrobiales bacterium]|nr:PIN domain-containing protein [Acidimicrobiales bacterium]